MKTTIILALLISATFAKAQDRYTMVKKNTMEGTKVGILDNQRQIEILPAVYDKILPIADNKFTIIKDGKLGYADTTGTVVISPRFKDGTTFSNGRAFILSENNKWGMINESGVSLGLTKYDDVIGLSEGVGRVVINQKIGFVGADGKEIIPCKYGEAYDCYEGLILAFSSFKDVWGDVKQKGQKVGEFGTTSKVPIVFDRSGKVIYRGEPNENVKFTPTGKIVITRTKTLPGMRSIDQSQMLDKTGKILIPFENNMYLDIREVAIKIIVTDGIIGQGIMNYDGTIILKPNFQEIDWFTEYEEGTVFAKAYFKNSSDFVYVDETGKCQDFRGVHCPN